MSKLFSKNSLPILTFVLVAISVSAAIRYLANSLSVPNQETLLSKALFISILVGWGVAVAAMVSWKVFGRQGKTSTLAGSWSAGAILIAIMPSLIFAIFGYPNQYGINPHLAGLFFGVMVYLSLLSGGSGICGS